MTTLATIRQVEHGARRYQAQAAKVRGSGEADAYTTAASLARHHLDQALTVWPLRAADKLWGPGWLLGWAKTGLGRFQPDLMANPVTVNADDLTEEPTVEHPDFPNGTPVVHQPHPDRAGEPATVLCVNPRGGVFVRHENTGVIVGALVDHLVIGEAAA